MEISTCYLNTQTPLGWLEIKAGLNGITSLQFVEYPAVDTGSNYYFEVAERQIKEYFAGKRRAFSVPIAPEGTDFDKRVWAEVEKIQFGETTSYARISRKLGNPGAMRAVGSANGRNPIMLLIPCHRVIGENGNLSGYAGGLRRKRWLLDWESRDTQPKLWNNTASLNNGLFRP